jgi:hypothetical protein
MVEKLIKDFKDFEKDLGMQKFLLKKGCQKVDDFEKEQTHVSSKLKDVTIQLEALEFQISCNVLWVGLAKNINLMSNGASVTTIPLPLKNPKSMFVKSPNAIIVKAYPICSIFYACNKIMMLSYGCTNHQFCAGLHLESKATHYVNPIWGKPISNDWIVSFSF